MLHKVLKKNEIDDNDLDIDTETGTTKKKTKPAAGNKNKSDVFSDRKIENAISYEWVSICCILLFNIPLYRLRFRIRCLC